MRFMCGRHLLTLGMLFILGCAKPNADSGAGGTAPTHVGGVTVVMPDHFAAVVVRPQQILKNPLLASLPPTLFESMVEQTGVQPADVAKVTVLLRTSAIPSGPGPTASPSSPPILVIEFARPVDVNSLATKAWNSFDKREYKGHTYLMPGATAKVNPSAQDYAYCLLDPQTVLFADENELQAMFDASPAKTRFSEMLAKMSASDDISLVADLAAVKDRAKSAIPAAGPQAAQMQAYTDMLNSVQSAELSINLSSNTLLHVGFTASDAASAQNIKTNLDGQIEAGKGLYKFMRPQLAQGIPEAFRNQVMPVLDKVVDGLALKQQASTISLDVARPEGLDAVLRDVLPKWAAAAKTEAKAAARVNDLKQIALAMHMFHDRYGSFPTGIRDAQGNLLLSWRVQLLPFLEEQSLFEQFKQDEPWDSPHNSALLRQIPAVYRDDNVNDGKTRMLAFAGEHALLNGQPRRAIREILDGTSNTFLFVQAGPDKAVPWSSPQDLTLDDNDPWGSLGALSNEGLIAAFCDGSVRVFTTPLKPDVLKKLVDPADLQPVEF